MAGGWEQDLKKEVSGHLEKRMEIRLFEYKLSYL